MNLPSLPIVPHALSLGLGVANRRFPSEHAPTLRHRAKANVEKYCTLLGKFGIKWWSSESMHGQ